MKIPIHISPDDISREAQYARYDLHIELAKINPNGWRVFHTNPNRKKQRVRPQKPSRMNRMAMEVLA